MNIGQARVAEGDIKQATKYDRKIKEGICYKVTDVSAVKIKESPRNTEYE
jgi:hypothetical protein